MNSEWLPIESYDKLKNKPQWAVFYIAEKRASRPRGFILTETISTERYSGGRDITHWMPLPAFPIKEANNE